jgi:tRNA-splicing ligase RtcB (3'-phosphate/5'-hydroxy nucleic acid ligase)
VNAKRYCDMNAKGLTRLDEVGGKPTRSAPWRQWGEGLEVEAVKQMVNACALPVAVAGALMPDAHVGYGLPIGGVLAADNAVIPYAVGVDIACRMKLTAYDRKANIIAGQRDRLANIIESETRFGMGCEFKVRREHQVMDEDWSVSPVTKRLRDKAWSQLGTSGTGNHFVEFGALTVDAEQASAIGLEPGEYLALLSHSGSRGAGAQVCEFYSKRAMAQHQELPKEFKQLAWLSLADADGQEYWAAMSLMGDYAAANHALIHRHIARKLGLDPILEIENNHNFAWKDFCEIGGERREVIVHRKGATPAGIGVLGIIPGSMASPGFVVRGKGSRDSLCSASHGAGRVMSRTKALQSFTWSATRKLLAERGVELLSAGLDEVPGVYKDIHLVMSAQTDLVEVLGRFDPKLVKMCPAGDRAED